MFNKNKKYEIDVKTADQMLQNVFAACNTEPNRIPFDKIVLKSKQNFKSDNSFMVATILLIIVTFVAPLLFPPSKVFLSVAPSRERPLVIEEHSLTEETFNISLKGATIDLQNTYMVGDSGEVLNPISYERESNALVFPFKNEEYNIYITDINGKTLHLLLSPRK